MVRRTHSPMGDTVAGITGFEGYEQQQHYFAVRFCGSLDYSGRPSAFQTHKANGISSYEVNRQAGVH